eukprot:scaffold8593_cov248-Pinguiococcus_pyrenoidosus.AAC.15
MFQAGALVPIVQPHREARHGDPQHVYLSERADERVVRSPPSANRIGNLLAKGGRHPWHVRCEQIPIEFPGQYPRRIRSLRRDLANTHHCRQVWRTESLLGFRYTVVREPGSEASQVDDVVPLEQSFQLPGSFGDSVDHLKPRSLGNFQRGWRPRRAPEAREHAIHPPPLPRLSAESLPLHVVLDEDAPFPGAFDGRVGLAE